ncbi:MAG: hypothetical protein AB1813_23885, partial [Verrucomicrobiota bacterium]
MTQTHGGARWTFCDHPFVENFVLNFADLDRKSFEKSSDKVCDKVCDKVFDKGKANASPSGSIP